MSTEQIQLEKSEEDDDPVELPADTLAILNEFLQSKQEQESVESGVADVEENWQLSQFWYNHDTKQTLSKICLKLILNRCKTKPTNDIKVALLSCPSLYKSIKGVHPNGEVRLFEFDTRFSKFKGDFIHYDYNEATKPEYLNEFKGYFDIIIADPPFLSEECIQNTSILIKKLKTSDAEVIVCSGAIVAEWIKKFLDLHQCLYCPGHERNLANEFCSYANFDLDSFI